MDFSISRGMENEFLCFISCPASSILLGHSGPRKSGYVVVSLSKHQILDAEGMCTWYMCSHTLSHFYHRPWKQSHWSLLLPRWSLSLSLVYFGSSFFAVLAIDLDRLCHFLKQPQCQIKMWSNFLAGNFTFDLIFIEYGLLQLACPSYVHICFWWCWQILWTLFGKLTIWWRISNFGKYCHIIF